jgi:DNA-binding beta-propeller fold protein YncE
LYVGSIPTSSISQYDEQGNPVTTSGSFPGLSAPNGIVYDPYNGLIYVADGGGSQPSNVFAFDEQGNAQPITFTISGDSFDQAWGIAVVP